MTVADRFADPLAAAWRGHRTVLPARVLASSDDAWDLDPDQATSPPHIHLVVAGQARLGDGFDPAGELVRTLQELSPHEALPGGPP
ncbi:hypothetical protein [Micromonospora luteifusca]|uniref:hypothetical protein n=1 Tax=Micromonospora luteifusca TaxID=709860 RepID=UPI0033B2C0FF